ncbi:addiction module toxin, GnsA/GnsB family [Escherichia coli]|nr:addiction module toxin, GnsA/GnsB family [Escherichia coli]
MMNIENLKQKQKHRGSEYITKKIHLNGRKRLRKRQYSVYRTKKMTGLESQGCQGLI